MWPTRSRWPASATSTSWTKSYIKTTLGTTYMSNGYDQDNIIPGTSDQPERTYRATEVNDLEQRCTVSSRTGSSARASTCVQGL